MRIGDLIRQRRAALRMSQAELARLVGVSRAAVGQWETHITAPTRRHIPEVARALQLELGALLPFALQSVELVDRSAALRKVPMMGWDAFVAGDGGVGDLPQVSVGADTPSDAVALRVVDHAMAPEIAEGDLIVVSRSVQPLDGDVVIAQVAGAGLLRRYHARGADSTGRLVFDLLSTSADFPTITCNSSNDHKVLATLVGHWKMRRR